MYTEYVYFVAFTAGGIAGNAFVDTTRPVTAPSDIHELTMSIAADPKLGDNGDDVVITGYQLLSGPTAPDPLLVRLREAHDRLNKAVINGEARLASPGSLSGLAREQTTELAAARDAIAHLLADRS